MFFHGFTSDYSVFGFEHRFDSYDFVNKTTSFLQYKDAWEVKDVLTECFTYNISYKVVDYYAKSCYISQVDTVKKKYFRWIKRQERKKYLKNLK
jgi:hypothetical protein